jgi:hypothetical protein
MNKMLLSIAAASLITGCSGHIYTKDGGCLTCINNPISGKPVNHDGQSAKKKQDTQATQQKSEVSGVAVSESQDWTQSEITFNVNKQIDLLAVKIKNEFRFESDEDIRREWGKYASDRFQVKSWKWQAVEGVYYHMASYKDHGEQHIPIDVVIEKVTDTSSKVVVNFGVEGNKAKAISTGITLKERILKAVNN